MFEGKNQIKEWLPSINEGEKELISSALAFSLMTVCVKLLGGRIPVAEIVFIRAIISLVITRAMLWRLKISPWGKSKSLLLLRGSLGTAALFCIFKALELLPLAPATILQYTYPTFTSIAAWIFLKEKLQKQIIAALLMGWIGITFVVEPSWITSNSNALPINAVLIALCGAILTAFAYICVRKLSKVEHPLVIIHYFPFISVPCTLPFVVSYGVFPTGFDWLWLMGIGIFTQLGQMGITKGLSLISASRACSINYSQVLFATLWGIIIFSEQISIFLSIGALFILGATVISVSNKPKIV